MNNLLQLKQERAALIDAARAIAGKAATDERPMTAAELTDIKAKMEQVEQYQKTIETTEKLDSMATDLNVKPSTRSTDKRLVAQVHDNWTDEPRLFKSFGEQLIAVRDAERARDSGSAGKMDPRLEELQTRAASGSSEAVPSDGGFLIQPDFSQQIWQIAHDASMLYQKTLRIPVTGNTLRIKGVDESSRATGSRWGGVQMYWADEADTVTASKPKFRLIELNLKKLFGLYYATDEVLADASALEAVAMGAFGEESAFVLDDVLIRGTGAGQPRGILTSECTVSVAKETGQTAGTFLWENAQKMFARLLPRAAMNAVWYMNVDMQPSLYKFNQAVGTGGVPVFLPPNGAAGAPLGTLMGRPIAYIEQCDTVGTKGDVILADFSYVATIEKGGLQSATSIHVRFLNDEMTFRWIFRVDAQPLLHKAITPYKGTNTLSPFVVLDNR